MTERSLVRRFLGGDDRAFDHLYDRHTPAMFQFALRFTGGVERDAEDIVQEAWLRAARGLAGFAWRSTLRTWLIGTTANCGHEWLRRRERRESAPPPESLWWTAGEGRSEPGNDLDLERAIASLDPDFRAVLLMHDLEGFTHAAIAARLGIEEGTSKSRLSRARARVRNGLTPDREPG